MRWKRLRGGTRVVGDDVGTWRAWERETKSGDSHCQRLAREAPRLAISRTGEPGQEKPRSQLGLSGAAPEAIGSVLTDCHGLLKSAGRGRGQREVEGDSKAFRCCGGPNAVSERAEQLSRMQFQMPIGRSMPLGEALLQWKARKWAGSRERLGGDGQAGVARYTVATTTSISARHGTAEHSGAAGEGLVLAIQLSHVTCDGLARCCGFCC